jgi:hypothetical protein
VKHIGFTRATLSSAPIDNTLADLGYALTLTKAIVAAVTWMQAVF